MHRTARSVFTAIAFFATLFAGVAPALAVNVTCSTGGDAAGWAVATRADFDGDGVADVAVGSPCARVQDERNAGKTSVYSGADGRRLLVVKGEHADQKFGGAVAFVADVSGDGLADLVVGSRGYDAPKDGGGTRNDAGRVEVFSRDGSRVLSVEGQFAGGGLGEAVAGLADVSGDGVPDVLAGAGSDRTGPGGDKVGAAYIFSGADGTVVDVSVGEFQFDEWGRVVSSAGDIDGDEIDDLIVASNLANVPGEPPTTSSTTTSTLSTSTTMGTTTTSTTSTTLAPDPPTQIDNGVVRILSGADMTSVIAEVSGAVPETKLGRSVSPCGDMNGDDVDDFFAGAPGLEPQGLSKAGGVMLFSSTGQTLATFAEPSPQAGAGFGTTVAAVGFVDEDAKTDILAAAPTAIVGSLDGAGRVHMMSGDDGSVMWTLSGSIPDMRMGQSLDGGPDWNDDGTPDAVIGVPGDAPSGRRGAGSVRIVSGADGSELRRFKGRRGLETRIFTAGWRVGGMAQVRSVAASGRRRGLRKQVFRRLRGGHLSIDVLDDAADPDPGLMRLVVGAGHGADDKSVKVLRAGRNGSIVSDFSASFSGPYAGGVNVAAGNLEKEDDPPVVDELAVVQADSDDGNVNLALYRRFDTDPLGRISWAKFDSFDVFDPGTDIDPLGLVLADGAHIAVGNVTGDSVDEIVAGPVLGAPVVRVFSSTGNLSAQWAAFPAGINSGTAVATGDVDGNGSDEIVVGPSVGNARIKVFNADGSPFLDPDSDTAVDFFVLSPGFTGGVRVAVADIDGDGKGEILAVPGGTGQLLAFEIDGTAVSGWPGPLPYGPRASGDVALATTDRFRRH